MDIQTVKKALNLTDGDIGKAFGYKNAHSYYQSARRDKIEAGVISIYELTKKSVGQKNMVDQAPTTD